MNWYAIQTHTSFEAQVAERLAAAGIETYWPSRALVIQHGRQKQSIRRALFPGYLFAQLEDHRAIAAPPRMVRVCGYGDHGALIPVSEIDSVRILAASPTVEPCIYFPPGQEVYIKYGPLAGVYGTVVRLKGHKNRVVVSVAMIGKSVSAEVEGAWLELRRAA